MNYTNYYKNHIWYLKWATQDRSSQVSTLAYKVKSHIRSYLKWKDIANIRVLEIGCGQWYFAQYCKELGVISYTWYDLDASIVEYCSELFPSYTFSNGDVYDHLQSAPNSYDIVFMSHVFEHIPIEQRDSMIQCIYSALKPWGQRINIMPNAWTLFMWTYWRYNDLTHITLYTENSYGQLLLENDVPLTHITHHNCFSPRLFKRNAVLIVLMRKCLSYLFKVIITLWWYPTGKVHTFEILSVISKDATKNINHNP